MRLSVRHPPDVLFVGPFSLYKYRYVAFSPSPRKMANTDLLVDRQTDRQTDTTLSLLHTSCQRSVRRAFSSILHCEFKKMVTSVGSDMLTRDLM